MNDLEIISLYLKDYLTNNEFETWVYLIDERVALTLNEEIYLELISCNYSNKEKCISLRYKLRQYMLDNQYEELERVNDAYVEQMIIGEEKGEIIDILRNLYTQVEKIEFKCNEIKNIKDLHISLKQNFGFSKYYGMNWSAFDDFICEVILPKEIIFKDWDKLNRILPKDAKIMKAIFDKKNLKDIIITYN